MILPPAWLPARRRTRPRRTIAVVVGLLTIAALRCAPAPDAAPSAAPSLLVVTIDTLRADHLGTYGYPRDTSPTIDRLAAESIVFESCLAPVAQTLPSHTSLFTATYPREHGIEANVRQQRDGLYRPSPHLVPLAEALRRAGYDTAAFVSAEPVKRGSGLEQGFAVWDEPRQKRRAGAATTSRAIDWLEARPAAQPGRPVMLWVHLFDPHAPYRPEPPYAGIFGDDARIDRYLDAIGAVPVATKRSRRGVKERVTRSEIDAYDALVRTVDDQLARLLATLERGAGGDWVVVVTSDHGEALGQHGLSGHGEIWREQLHVPLVVRVPGERPRRVATPLSLVDVLPTLAALVPALPAGAALARASGIDVLAAEPAAPRPLLAQRPAAKAFALESGGWRLLRWLDGDRLYHLTSDPHELRDVLADHPQEAERLRASLTEIRRGQERRRRANAAGEVVPFAGGDGGERLRNLEALGYLR